MTVTEPDHTAADLNRLYSVLRSRLARLSVAKIENVAGAAGFDLTRVPTGSSSRNELLPALDRLFGEMAPVEKLERLRLLADEIVTADEDVGAEVHELLGRHGYQFLNGQFVAIGVLDAREARFLPDTSASELARAAARLTSDDWSGAITSACGAVDLATQAIYEREALGDPGRASFQTKVNTALQHLRVFEVMEQQFVEQGMGADDARELVEHSRQATNRASQALQILRRAMGDTHGSRPALKSMAYDAVKWASAICALFEGR